MKRKITTFIEHRMLLLLLFCIFTTTQILHSQTFVGDKTLKTQDEVNDFGANYTSITGNLTIGSSFTITNLDALSSLTSVEGTLNIRYNSNLTNVDGLANLEAVQGGLIIVNNDDLTNVNGFSGLTIIEGGTLNVSGNGALVDISGFENITTLEGSLIFDNNNALTNVDGFESVISIGGGVGIRNNDNLTNLDGFASLTTVTGQLTISDNPSLTDLSGFSSLSSICCIIVRDNDALINLEGFDNISSLLGLLIDYNDALEEIDGFGSLSSFENNFAISDNSALVDINTFSGIISVENIRITRNHSLVTLDAFTSLTTVSGDLSIYDNDALTEITSLENLQSVGGDLEIEDNPMLNNCCSIAHLVDDDPNNGQVDGSITILNNPNGCSSVSDIIASCALPPGWEASPNGIGCTDGNDVSFDNSTQTFTITSEGCYDPNFYSNSDAHGFVYTELCGDGEIIAEIQSVDGNGWAGISMRESTNPDAKMLQMLIDGVFLTQRQMRTSTGGLAYKHQFQTQGKNWLRLTRSGNTFGAYHSSDGINWSAVLVTTISMSECIPVGLVTMNSTPNGTMTATFGSVQIKNNAALYAPQTIDIAETDQQLSIYPNPASDRLWIRLPLAIDQEVQVKVYNQLGQPVKQRVFDAQEITAASMDVSALPPGAYVLEVLFDGQREVRKVVVE